MNKQKPICRTLKKKRQNPKVLKKFNPSCPPVGKRKVWLAPCEGSPADFIRKAQNKLGMTQDDLVRKSVVKYTTITKIESDVVIKPSAQTVAKIAKASGVSMENLVK